MHDRARSLASVLAAIAGLSAAGCGDLLGNKDAHEPGTALGRFHVKGTRTSNACGEGALGAGATWEFDVSLARGEEGRGQGALFWDNGAQVVSGALAPDGMSFQVEARVSVDMRTDADRAMPPCTIERHDLATGVLDSASEDVNGFTGRMQFDFAPTGDSECSDLVSGEAPVVAALPCSMAFDLAAARTAAPPGSD